MFTIKGIQGTPAFMEAFTEIVFVAQFNFRTSIECTHAWKSRELLQKVIDATVKRTKKEPIAIFIIKRFRNENCKLCSRIIDEEAHYCEALDCPHRK